MTLYLIPFLGKENGGKEDEFIFLSTIFFSKDMKYVIQASSQTDRKMFDRKMEGKWAGIFLSAIFLSA